MSKKVLCVKKSVRKSNGENSQSSRWLNQAYTLNETSLVHLNEEPSFHSPSRELPRGWVCWPQHPTVIDVGDDIPVTPPNHVWGIHRTALSLVCDSSKRSPPCLLRAGHIYLSYTASFTPLSSHCGSRSSRTMSLSSKEWHADTYQSTGQKMFYGGADGAFQSAVIFSPVHILLQPLA